MKKIFYIILISLIPFNAYSAGSDSSEDTKSNYYNDAKKLVKQAGKFEKKKKQIKPKNFILKHLKN